MTSSYKPEQLSGINLQTIIESNTNKMAEALRATISLLKTFDGNPNHLEAFINIIDIFYHRYYTGDESQKEFVELAIQSKLIGEANNFLLTRPDLTTWSTIKDALRLKFGDPISRQNLTQQLMFSTRPRNESTLEYVHRLKTLVHRITSKIQSESLDHNTKLTLIAQTELTATHNLMSNVSQELKTILIIQNPSDLTTALNLITNYEMINNQISFKSNYNQMSNSNRSPIIKSTLPPISSFAQLRQQPPSNFNSNFQFQQSRPFPSQPVPVRPQPSKIQTHFPTNRDVFGKPQNVFKPTNNTNFPKPTPMSGVSVQPRRPINNPNANQSRVNNSFSNNHFNNQNYWRNNPHANPLVFQEITHLENLDGASGDSNEASWDNQYNEYHLEYINEPQFECSENQFVSNMPDNFADNETQENFPITASEQLHV